MLGQLRLVGLRSSFLGVYRWFALRPAPAQRALPFPYTTRARLRSRQGLHAVSPKTGARSAPWAAGSAHLTPVPVDALTALRSAPAQRALPLPPTIAPRLRSPPGAGLGAGGGAGHCSTAKPHRVPRPWSRARPHWRHPKPPHPPFSTIGSREPHGLPPDGTRYLLTGIPPLLPVQPDSPDSSTQPSFPEGIDALPGMPALPRGVPLTGAPRHKKPRPPLSPRWRDVGVPVRWIDRFEVPSGMPVMGRRRCTDDLPVGAPSRVGLSRHRLAAPRAVPLSLRMA